MSRQVKLFGLLFIGMMLALAFGLLSSGSAAAAPQAAPSQAVVAQACDTSGSIDGNAVPTSPLPGQTITFTVMNFRPGEEASYWFTLPSGGVFGTARPQCCAANDGYIRFEPVVLPNEFYQVEGRWALTVQGKDSGHTSVVYFCLFRQVQPTQPPATATSVPATATSAPATSTAPPVTSPTAAASPTVGTTATAAGGTPTGVTGTATSVVSTPTTVATSIATTAVPTLTTATAVPTSVVETPTPVLPTETASAVPTIVGMPRTGQNESTLLAVVVLIGLSLLAVGWAVRHSAPGRSR